MTGYPDQKFIRITPVADACSTFPVDFALLNHGGMQFVAFYDDSRRITVASRSLDGGTWVFSQPEGRWLTGRNRSASFTDYDSHNYLTMAADAGGYLHLSGNMHGDPLVYFRSRNPLDITSFAAVEQMIGQDEDKVTYPLFFHGPKKELLFRYRDGASGNGVDYYNIYDLDAQSWSRLLDKPLLNGEGERNGYARLPQLGPDGRWHLIGMWRETPDCATNNNLFYARSSDLIHWERSDGTHLTLPITRKNGEIIDPAPTGAGLINMSQDLGFDHTGRPIVTYHRYDVDGNSQIFSARLEKGLWKIRPLSRWTFRWNFGGVGSIAQEVSSTPVRPGDAGRLEVSYCGKEVGTGRWILDEETMEVLEILPSREEFPDELLIPRQQLHPQMEVRVVAAMGETDGKKYYLRWETLPLNRDIPHAVKTPPTRLEVVEVG